MRGFAMNRRSGLAIAAIVMLMTIGAQARGATSAITIHIDGPVTVHSGDDIDIGVTLTNQSQKAIEIATSMGGPRRGEHNFQIVVRDQYGQSVQKTTYGLARDGRGNPLDILTANHESRAMLTLEPAGQIDDSVVVNHLFDMTIPGDYSIRVTRQMEELEGEVVRSNVIRVTVTQ
jgi:hypothetical protein